MSQPKYMFFHNRSVVLQQSGSYSACGDPWCTEEVGARGGSTVAVLKTDFKAAFSASVPKMLPIKVGIAKTHPQDNYNKRVGRELALARTSYADFYLHSLNNDDVVYKDEKGNTAIFGIYGNLRRFFPA